MIFARKLFVLHTLLFTLNTCTEHTVPQKTVHQKSRISRFRERTLKFWRCVLGTQEYKSEEKQAARATLAGTIGVICLGYVLIKCRSFPRRAPRGSGASPASEESGDLSTGAPPIPSGEAGTLPPAPVPAPTSSPALPVEEGTEKEKIPLQFERVEGTNWDPNSWDPVEASWTRALLAVLFGK